MKRKTLKFPKTKISEVFLEFSMPLIESLGDNPTKNQIEEILKITYTVWNSVIIDKFKNNDNNINMLKEAIKYDLEGLALVEELISRKVMLFPNDLRLIGNYSIKEKNEEWKLRVEARDPSTAINPVRK